jgi:hypothetical protein
MTTDQSRLAKSRLLVADALTRDRAAATKPDPHDTASWLLDQLQTLGWKQPPDPALDLPPARPAHPATDDSPGRQAFRTELCQRYGHQPEHDTCRRCGTHLDTAAQTIH